jgi:acyl-CoA thioesterase-1
MSRLAAVLAALMLLAFDGLTAHAATSVVVAIGASNTYGAGRRGGGVGTSEAFPAQLEGMLKARGYDVRVINAGVPGDTTAGMLARLDSAVPEGTRVVVIQPGGNDARRGGSAEQAAGNVSQMVARLRARGIKTIVLPRILSMVPASSRDPDGQHFDARGHAAIAARLVPQVIGALRR